MQHDLVAGLNKLVYFLTIYLFFACSSLSRGDPLLKVSADIVNEVVKESATQIIRSMVDEVVRGHMTVIKTSDWLEDLILEAITPMLPRLVRTHFFTETGNSNRKLKLKR